MRETRFLEEAGFLSITMRHLKRGRKLGRNASHRKAMFRNMANALFEHEEIVTTVAKAKELRPFAERLITLARAGALANRGAQKLREKASEHAPDDPGDKECEEPTYRVGWRIG